MWLLYNIAIALLNSTSHRSFSTGFVEDRENQSARREMADHKTYIFNS